MSGISGLYDAADAGDCDQILLLMHGKQPSEVEVLLNSERYLGAPSILGQAVNGLPWKASADRTHIVELLLNMGARLVSSEPLRTAILNGHRRALTIMLTHPGVDADDLRRALAATENNPLVMAVCMGDLAAVKALVKAGAPVCMPADGLSAFGHALYEGKAKIVEFFLDNGQPADPTVLERGYGYLALAARHEKTARFVPRLLALGCDPRVGNNPLIQAIRVSEEAVNLLLRDTRTLEIGQHTLRWLAKPSELRIAHERSRAAKFTGLLLRAGVNPMPLLEAQARGEVDVSVDCFKELWVSPACCSGV